MEDKVLIDDNEWSPVICASIVYKLHSDETRVERRELPSHVHAIKEKQL